MSSSQSPTTRFDPHEMALRGRIGAYRLHATHDPMETTAKARATFLSKFEREVDPDGVFPEAERTRRAEAARKAHFLQLARLSANKRRTTRDSRTTELPAPGAVVSEDRHAD